MKYHKSIRAKDRCRWATEKVKILKSATIFRKEAVVLPVLECGHVPRPPWHQHVRSGSSALRSPGAVLLHAAKHSAQPRLIRTARGLKCFHLPYCNGKQKQVKV